MDYNSERLIETLIKMVGKLNHKIASLESRINYLESIKIHSYKQPLYSSLERINDFLQIPFHFPALVLEFLTKGKTKSELNLLDERQVFLMNGE